MVLSRRKTVRGKQEGLARKLEKKKKAVTPMNVIMGELKLTEWETRRSGT